jgi:O-antigen ligase
MNALAIIVAGLFALFVGLVLAVAGELGFVLLVPLMAVALILYDYRVAVILLAMLIPLSGSMFVPRLPGLNPYTYLTAAAIVGLIMSRFTGSKPFVWPPRVLLFCFALPLLVGVILGLPRLDEGERNLRQFEPQAILDATGYIRRFILTPVVLIGFSVLLANAVADSKKPERFVVLFALSAVSVVTYVILFTLSKGVGWGPHRWVIGKAGMHYNNYGQLFALAFGPLLYVAFSERGVWRYFFGFAALVVFVGLVFNFARAGMLAGLITLGMFLWHRRSFGVAATIVGLLLVVIVFAPEEWHSRMFQGADEVTSSYRGERYTELTAGRLVGWFDLAPDVALSPLYGRGMLSTLWSDAVRQGLYVSNHPHNMYLQLLLDVGVLGFAAVLFFFYALLRKMRDLSRDEAIEPRLRAFFAGSFASFAAVLALSVTGWSWYPEHEQGFLWFSVGLVFAYWRRSAKQAVPDSDAAASMSFRRAPQAYWRSTTTAHRKQ